jgi:hypothetical protein
VLNFILGMGMFGGLAALPLYLQIVKGASPTMAGLLLIPLTFGIMAGSIISGQSSPGPGGTRSSRSSAPVCSSSPCWLGQIGVETPLG